MIEIVLAGRPMGKERVRRAQMGHAYTPERTVRFESRLAFEAQHVMNGRAPLGGPLMIDLVVLMPITASKSAAWKRGALAGEIRPTTKPDWDNFAKILDALNMIVWTDDALIVEGTVQKWYSPQPLFAVRVAPLSVLSGVPSWVLRHTEEGIYL